MNAKINSADGMTKSAKNLAGVSLLIFAFLLTVGASPALATHTSSAELQPEWSAAGQNMDYTVTFYNDANSTHAIGEVRIYRNDQYTNFVCDDKTGWYRSEPAPGICNYYALPQATNSIPPGGSAQFTFSAITPDKGCEWTWQFETRDVTFPNQGSINYLSDTTSVDSMAPTINKTLSGTVLEKDGITWITQDTDLNIEVYDNGDQCGKSGLNYCEYRYDVDGVEAQPWTNITWGSIINGHYYYTLNYDEDSEHRLEIRCRDNAGNMAYHSQTEKVDSTKPETTKTYGDPHYPADINDGGAYPHYINTSTPITLTAVDPQAPTTPQGVDCSVDGVKTYYRDFVTETSKICLSEQMCNPEYYGNPNIPFTEYTSPIIKGEESCHVLEYYSVDELGNTEETKYQCVFVENKTAVVSADTGSPKIPCDKTDPSECDYWIQDHVTPITLSCYDREPHPSGVKSIEYRWKLDGNWPVSNPNGNWLTYEKPIIFNEDSIHSLEYRCTDNLGHIKEGPGKIYRVDSVAPVITKTMIGTYLPGEVNGKCPPDPNSNQTCYVADNGQSGVRVNVTDPDPTGHGCNVGGITCNYNVTWETTESECRFAQGEWLGNGLCLLESGTFTDTKDILFREDSTHHVNIECSDALGNTVEETEKFLVDSTPPVTEKEYGTPTEVKNGYRWITSATPITLTATDNKVGVSKISYRVTLLPKADYPDCMESCESVGSGDFEDISDDEVEFTIDEDSCHFIEFQSTDKLGYTEPMKSQCVFVDNKAPVTTKIIGNPNIVKGNETYVNNSTTITLTCNDLSPHPVGNEKGYYRYFVNGNLTKNWTAIPSGQPFTFPEDSNHTLEYYCVDGLGNTEQVKSEVDIVDSVPPAITTSIVGPTYYNASESKTYIDGVTTIHVEASDPQPHPVEGVTCDWSYSVRENQSAHGGNTNVTVPFDINFPEESTHDLTITCRDALGNSASDYKTYIVDKTAPVTVKDFVGPQYLLDAEQASYPRWINSNTNITLTVDDAGPHKSGIKETKYRVTLLDNDEYCNNYELCQNTSVGSGGWNEYSNPFRIGEESCHLIEYYSTDNVNKTQMKKQCVFVDNTAPEPVKAVGKPGIALNNGTQEYTFTYYPEVNGKCWNGQGDSIDCWKVTTLTPISLDCNDQLPHPVDHSKVWFKVGLDGSDVTEEYCDSYGEFNQNGYCLITEEEAPVQFYFGEESEHNLKYYCEDALGNTGPVDDEKFKVEGTAFTIQLNKKWNLISVPFAMLDNSIAKAFEDVAGTVESVWAYDSVSDTWQVYTPGPAPDTLNEMMPGNGYWVKSLNDSTLVIGGSLFSPAQTPSSKKVVKGWNLIGYWGTEEKLEYDGPQFQGKTAKCELYSIGDSMLDKQFASLWSYWEPYNPDLWISFDSNKRMDPGAGYWLYTNQNGDFVVPTTCSLYD